MTLKSRLRFTQKKKAFQKGLLGEGFHGKTYRVGYNSKKSDSLYNYIDKENIIKIKLYTLNPKNDTFLTEEKDIAEFLKYLHKKKDTIAKIFKNTYFYTGKTVDEDLKEELDANLKVIHYYGKDAKKYLTISPVTGFRNLKIIGANIEIKEHDDIYITFSTECDNKYGMDADKFIVEILESVAVLQKAGYQHNDIKLDNIVLCENRYKLIDWGQAGFLNEIKFGDMICSNPIKWYLKGAPKFVAKPLMKVRASLINSGYKNSELFNEIYTSVNNEFEVVTSTIQDKETLFKVYKDTFDVFMVGMTLVHAIHRFKLDEQKYVPLAKKLISLINPIHDATEALRMTKKYISTF